MLVLFAPNCNGIEITQKNLTQKVIFSLTSLICPKTKLILKEKDKEGPRHAIWSKQSVQMGPTQNVLRHVFFAYQGNARGKK